MSNEESVTEIAHRLGYWAVYTNSRILIHRFDQSTAFGTGVDGDDEARDHLARIETLPRWRLNIDGNPNVVRAPYGVEVRDPDTGDLLFTAATSHGATHIVVHAEPGDNPTLGGVWEMVEST